MNLYNKNRAWHAVGESNFNLLRHHKWKAAIAVITSSSNHNKPNSRTTIRACSHLHTHAHIYTHMLTYTHTCSHLHTHAHIYTHTLTFTHTRSHLHTHAHIYTHMLTFTHACTHARTHTCIPPPYHKQLRIIDS